MLDHIGFKVSEYERSKTFYLRALAPLGHGLVMEVAPEMTGTDSRHAGFGSDRKPSFWIGWVNAGADVTRGSVHVAFAAKHRAAVPPQLLRRLRARSRRPQRRSRLPHTRMSPYR